MSPLSQHAEAVSASYSRVRGHGFAHRFYDRLLATDPAVRRAFANTDFERQRDLFLHGLFALIDYARDGAMGRMAVNRLKTIHGPGQLAIPKRLYELWLETLLETLSETDPQWSPELAETWSSVLGPGIAALRGT